MESAFETNKVVAQWLLPSEMGRIKSFEDFNLKAKARVWH